RDAERIRASMIRPPTGRTIPTTRSPDLPGEVHVERQAGDAVVELPLVVPGLELADLDLVPVVPQTEAEMTHEQPVEVHPGLEVVPLDGGEVEPEGVGVGSQDQALGKSPVDAQADHRHGGSDVGILLELPCDRTAGADGVPLADQRRGELGPADAGASGDVDLLLVQEIVAIGAVDELGPELRG